MPIGCGRPVKTIGRYIVCGLLGKGGMAKVYKVKLPVIEQLAALKLLAPPAVLVNLLGRAQLEKMFAAEAATMARLRHPNLLALRDFDHVNGRPFIVMEYYCRNLGALIGETLPTEAPSRPLSADKAIDYTRQMLQGLDFLHHAGIVHRDVKPFNLLISDQDTIKVADFGLSRRRGETYAGPPHLKVGSPFYAAPEQENDPDHAGFAADVYATGVVFHRLLTGQLPTAGGPAPSRCRPELDPAFDRFVATATAVDPRKRFADAGVMGQALEALALHWQKHKQAFCLMGSPDEPRTEPAASPLSRQAPWPTPVTWRQAADHWHLDGLGRPKAYRRGPWQARTPETVVNLQTGLVWQTAGSPYPLSWPEAHEHIAHINQIRFAGMGNWRLPSVDELIDLLRPPAQGATLCVAPVFDSRQKWLWSGNRRSVMTVWFVSLDLGYVAWQDKDCRCHVRAVCDAPRPQAVDNARRTALVPVRPD
jgi:serine/threonine-protein kinase